MTVSARTALSFNSDTGMIASLSVPRADISLTAERAQIAMQEIIDLDIVSTSNGMPVSIKGAEIITTQRTNIIPG